MASEVDVASLLDKFRDSELSLLEFLVDRLHLLILSCAQMPSDSFVPIGKAADSLIAHLKVVHERPLSAGFVGGDGNKRKVPGHEGSTVAYSPNYEEDVRREMFPFVQSLVTSMNMICKKYVIPCTSHDTWQKENRNLDKKTFVTVTACIRNDMERVSRVFQRFDTKEQELKARVKIVL